MAKSSPKKGGHLGHRDLQRTGLALDLLSGAKLTSSDIKAKYYSDLSDGSFHKTLKRDLAALEAEGVYVRELPRGTAKDYEIDKTRSTAQVNSSDNENFVALATMMRPLVDDPETPDSYALGSAITRIALSSGAGAMSAPTSELDCDFGVLQTVVQAMQQRKQLSVIYQALSDDKPTRRKICPYGIFTLLGSAYVVGLRTREGEDEAIRTFNLSRFTKAEFDEDARTYVIPSDFNLKNYQYKPFEVGPDDEEVIIYARRKQASLLKQEAPKSGRYTTKQGGTAQWQGRVKNLAAAASWCVQHGFLPLEPMQLVDAWRQLLGEATNEQL